MRKSIDFSRRSPAWTRDRPPSFSSARAHGRRRPARSAPRSARPRARPRPSLTSSRSRRATSSSTSAPPTASRATSRWLSRNAFQSMPACARIDLLFHQPPREVLEAPIDFALDERRRHVERHARGELLHQLGAHLALGARAAPRARDPRARARAARRAFRTRPGPSRTRRRAPAGRAA